MIDQGIALNITHLMALGMMLVAALCAVPVVFAKNPITSGVSLIVVMVCLGGLYALMGAHLVAALQIVVYAGAIMVLIIFSIMLLNMNTDDVEVSLKDPKILPTIALGSIAAGIVGFAFLKLYRIAPIMSDGPYTLAHIKALGGNAVAMSGALFSQYYWHFELLSLLLLVAIVAALVLAKRKVD